MEVARISWEEAQRRMQWTQGEHVSLIGPTGCGKTTLALSIMPMRGYSCVFGTKPKDATLAKLQRRGWKRINSWNERPPLTPERSGKPKLQRLILWPKFSKVSDVEAHQHIFDKALREMFVDNNWAIFVDEVGYITKNLKLEAVMKIMWQQGRSLGISMVTATQRPAWVPLEMYSQATHLFLWRSNDRRDLERLRDVSGQYRGKELEAIVTQLDYKRHEVLYVNTRTGVSFITIPPSGT